MTLFLLDENLSPHLAIWLRHLGYAAKAARETNLKGRSDEDVVRWAQKHKAVILTSDLDFGEFFYGKSLGAFGVIILRSRSQGIDSFKKILKTLHAGKVLKDKRLISSLLVADENNYRWRKFNIE
ncbi:hypothetical protein A3B05_02100 [Candidatus Giovannonibacteria bacterium RIFCSPLOWO2_01_FULL_43_160]|nr:MAG: hypothetical protein UV72_C0002G0091 [Candidatus Giovannonibacteria bacterium GW2011_GWB1_43_13]OGF70005.1 MAG: hypothetical protein A3C76_02360 [Candidatus Giovannonibacteria bacterium RIFCSPHIGHO2_02_FULL_44_51]OGF72017.1 MAG: hypothetical protein A3E35_03460 [Candidatus Giovannonibacteria bacterium RIFCSPHIGHO2_12_FULL_44_22]OGF75415.1 MAG: hypothetical protein A3B05_02100 [Candidatus Giovannonibacteria bacterium RIFCSPLOWO2_01_FULL_43_160]